ncbi:CACTA en-spm transposon protein [Cucumis melo var. makuwa]|uniref:CACTA en-spm transposon protein n=1 Tax=Cucumis melo var. makuwa TaxID=1194695 RepID=A0A5D3BBD4_CUCMM|nr:CACTA en-spm transposon protein [Cucumis melo var. makuwa]
MRKKEKIGEEKRKEGVSLLLATVCRRCLSLPSSAAVCHHIVMVALFVLNLFLFRMAYKVGREETEDGRLEDEMSMNVRVLNGLSNKSFDMLLELLRAAFPIYSSTIPSSFYKAKRKLRDLGLGYETIHACKYDCVLYWKEFVDLQHCPTCGEDRDKRVEIDDVLRHPADVEGWKHFNSEYPDFAYNLGNVRLSLALDGFNPFDQMSTSSFRIRGRIFFMGHRCYLPENHAWCRSRLHDGKDKKRKKALNWIKRSIFFELPYWSRLLLRHKLDVMHIEKNVCDNLVEKTKDTINARLDLQDLKIRKDLHLVEYVRNKVRPEGSIAKAYVTNESSTFCLRYLSGIKTQFTRDKRNDDTIVKDEIIGDFEIFKQKVRPLGIMSSAYPRHNFLETDAIFLKFEDELDNFVGGSSSVGNNAGPYSQQPIIPTPRRRAQSRLLEMEHHIAVHGRISMTIALGAEKSISSHALHFSQAIGMCLRKIFPVRCLNLANIDREYIEVVKDDLQRFFVLNFNVQVMNKFVEHQMFTTFKKFRADCHRHFKKYSNLEEARANPPNILEQSRTNKAARQKQSYNQSSGSKSFLQRQHKLAEKKGESIDRVELFRETHIRVWTFVSQAIEDTIKKDVARGLPDVGDFVGKNDVERGIPDVVEFVSKNDVGRRILDAVLVTHQEYLFRLTSRDVRPDAAENFGISFSDVFSLFLTFLCVGSTPFSCSDY